MIYQIMDEHPHTRKVFKEGKGLHVIWDDRVYQY